MGQNNVPIVQFDLEHGVRQGLEDSPLDLNAFLF
jgi:hypothetical protein